MNKDTLKDTKNNNKPQITRVKEWLNERYDFRYNEIANEVDYKLKDESDWQVCNENDIYIELLEANFNVSDSKLRALFSSSFVHRYNPFVEYTENLPDWHPDKDPDHIAKLASYIQTSDQDRFLRQFRKMFVRFLACATIPKIENKHAFVFYGKQHDGKSRLCEFFCPPSLAEYQTDSFQVDKDGEIALTANFLINLDELSTFSKSDINAIKNIIQKNAVKVRPPYGRKPVRMARTANFIGNTNQEEFLADETGNVRWICFEVLEIDWKGYSKDVNIDLVYAQAKYLLNHGFKYQLTPEDIQENELANIHFRINTPEMELVRKYYEHGSKTKHDNFMTATDILQELSEKSLVRLNVSRLGKAMKALGHERKSYRKEAEAVKGYFISYRKEPESYKKTAQVQYASNKQDVHTFLEQLPCDKYSVESLFSEFSAHHEDNILIIQDFQEVLKGYCTTQNSTKKAYSLFSNQTVLEVISVNLF